MTTRLITPPATEPVTLAEAKIQCRVDIDDDDTLIQGYIAAARSQCEHIIGRSIMPQTWELSLDAFSSLPIKLLYGPVTAITSVDYVDTAGDDQTFVDFNLDEANGYLSADNWPATYTTTGAVKITYEAGDADAERSGINQWILIAVATFYKNRESQAAGSTTELPRGFMAGLLDRYMAYD